MTTLAILRPKDYSETGYEGELELTHEGKPAGNLAEIAVIFFVLVIFWNFVYMGVGRV